MSLQFACSAFTSSETVLAADCGCAITEEDADVIERAIDASSDILAILSGFRFAGLCEHTVRPIVPSGGACFPHRGGYDDLRLAGSERFGGLLTIPLRGPNVNILEVTIDGVALDPDEYMLLDGEYLARKEGQWPTTNDLTLDPSADEGTFQIRYRSGSEGGLIEEAAALELTCELTKAWLGKRSQFSPGVTSANIQGAAVTVDRQARDQPSTLPAVVRFLAVYAPEARDGSGGRHISGVWSPELTQGWELVEVATA